MVSKQKDLGKEMIRSKVDLEKILEVIKEKLDAIESKLNDLANEIKAMKVKDQKELLQQPPLMLYKEEFIKKEVIEWEDNKIET